MKTSEDRSLIGIGFGGLRPGRAAGGVPAADIACIRPGGLASVRSRRRAQAETQALTGRKRRGEGLGIDFEESEPILRRSRREREKGAAPPSLAAVVAPQEIALPAGV